MPLPLLPTFSNFSVRSSLSHADVGFFRLPPFPIWHCAILSCINEFPAEYDLRKQFALFNSSLSKMGFSNLDIQQPYLSPCRYPDFFHARHAERTENRSPLWPGILPDKGLAVLATGAPNLPTKRHPPGATIFCGRATSFHSGHCFSGNWRLSARLPLLSGPVTADRHAAFAGRYRRDYSIFRLLITMDGH